MTKNDTGAIMKTDLLHEATKASPALAGAGYSMSGMPWSEIAAILTAVYVLLQIGLLVPKYIEVFKKWRSKPDS